MSTIISYDLLEDSIVGRLSPLRSLGYEVTAVAENTAALKPTTGFNPKITVAYRKSNFGDNADSKNPLGYASGVMVQEEFAFLTIVFESQKLRTNRGYYEAYRQATKLLLGHKVPGWSGLFFRDNEFVSAEDGVFMFALTVSCYRLVVEASDQFGTPTGLDCTTGLPALPNLTEANFSTDESG